eukprot:12423262-Karenia_brevis.AAC.1
MMMMKALMAAKKKQGPPLRQITLDQAPTRKGLIQGYLTEGWVLFYTFIIIIIIITIIIINMKQEQSELSQGAALQKGTMSE